jgi:peroxiredoxin Q/BCP
MIMVYRATWTSRLKPGMKAPEFEAILDDGSTVSSKALKGKPLVLFFYNHDGTETCTVEACNLRDNYQKLIKKGFRVIGVSEDSVRKHQGFKKKYSLPFPLISDTGNVLAKQFDVFGEKKFMGRVSNAVHRTTFVISSDWKITAVIHPVISADHAAQIFEL